MVKSDWTVLNVMYREKGRELHNEESDLPL